MGRIGRRRRVARRVSALLADVLAAPAPSAEPRSGGRRVIEYPTQQLPSVPAADDPVPEITESVTPAGRAFASEPAGWLARLGLRVDPNRGAVTALAVVVAVTEAPVAAPVADGSGTVGGSAVTAVAEPASPASTPEPGPEPGLEPVVAAGSDPDAVKRAMMEAAHTPGERMRLVGIASAIVGVAIVWAARKLGA